ncbi:MAG: carotenoid oxygenase family protein, partial [Allosphingosinicella sp.]
VWEAPPDRPLQEPCFIPRSPDAAEGDGWIIQAATDASRMLTELNLFEATRIAKGPVATIRLPFRMKPALHGSWADAAQIRPTGLPARSEDLAPAG